MNTPAHMMLNLGLLARKKSPFQQLVVLVGAVLPDVPLFVFYFWEKVWRALSEAVIWEQYFDAWWQMVFDLFHSFPVAILGGALSLLLKWKGLALFWASMALHSLGDIFFIMMMRIGISFPLTDWQFASPVSYWDPHYHGDVFAIMEILMVAMVGLWIWRGATWVGTEMVVGSFLTIYVGYL